jgi:hypothetical protein
VIQNIADQTARWLAETGAPNGVVLLAVLTDPKTWATQAQAAVSTRLGETRDGPEETDT